MQLLGWEFCSEKLSENSAQMRHSTRIYAQSTKLFVSQMLGLNCHNDLAFRDRT